MKWVCSKSIHKGLSKTAAEHAYNYFSEEIRLGISCDSSPSQLIHMKCQALFSLKNTKKKKKKKKMTAVVVISTLRVNP